MNGYDITESVNGTKLKDAFADYFTLGAAINGTSHNNSTIALDAMAEVLKYHFNSTTFSNLMKPQFLLDQQQSINNIARGVKTPAVKFSAVEPGLKFCQLNGIKMRGHVLVWHAQTPDWFFREGYQNNGAYVDKETMLMRMESYIKQVLEYTQTNYPGVIYCWDVVNEAIENTPGWYETQSGFTIRTKSGSGDNLWYKVVGIDYVEKAFEYARKYADPSVKLFYNDYNTFQTGRRESIYKLAKYLKEKGIIDGIGMQGYMSLYYPGIKNGSESVRNAINRFAELGLEIHITELTINTDDKKNSEEAYRLQAARYKELFELLLELDTDGGGKANITNVTFFGVMDDYHFYKNTQNNPEYSRLFDGNLKPKPAFYSILALVEKK